MSSHLPPSPALAVYIVESRSVYKSGETRFYYGDTSNIHMQTTPNSTGSHKTKVHLSIFMVNIGWQGACCIQSPREETDRGSSFLSKTAGNKAIRMLSVKTFVKTKPLFFWCLIFLLCFINPAWQSFHCD